MQVLELRAGVRASPVQAHHQVRGCRRGGVLRGGSGRRGGSGGPGCSGQSAGLVHTRAQGGGRARGQRDGGAARARGFASCLLAAGLGPQVRRVAAERVAQPRQGALVRQLREHLAVDGLRERRLERRLERQGPLLRLLQRHARRPRAQLRGDLLLALRHRVAGVQGPEPHGRDRRCRGRQAFWGWSPGNGKERSDGEHEGGGCQS
mmetsp:Transcript_32551/g.92881  ORF Transcript_32551/g.92881 Transcript_32551/m.92881 type:complete len:206 (-) Transcript_32551:295-912(-)